MISADLAKLEAFGAEYIFMLLESRMREVLFRTYVTDALGRLVRTSSRWAEIAYPETDTQQIEEQDHRSTKEVADDIINGLSAILERKGSESN